MGGRKVEKYGETDKADRLKIFLQGFGKRIGDFKIERFKYAEPDLAKLEAVVKKGAKVAFEIEFENDKLVATAAGGGTNLTLASVDLAKETDRAKRRAMLEKINNISALADAKDLAEFDRKFPDPQKVQEVQNEVTQLKNAMQRDAGLRKSRPAKLADMSPGELEVSFSRWAEGKVYANFLKLYVAIENGGPPKKIAADYIVTGAPTPVKLTDATRKAVEAALAKQTDPNLDAAHREAAAVVQARLFPEYRRWVDEGMNKRQQENQKKLVDAQAKLKALTGK